MTHHDLEQECAKLRAQVAELEARLAAQAPVAANGDTPPSASAWHGETRLLRGALRSLSDGVIICNADGKLVYFNAVATELFGVGVTDAGPSQWSARYGLYLLDTVTPFPPSELPLARALRGEDASGIEIFIRTEQRPEGTYTECSARPIHDDAGHLCGAVVVCRDIGEHKRWQAEREQRLLAEEQRIAAENDKLQMAQMLKTLLDHLDVVLWMVDAKGVFTFHEGRGLKAAGLSPGQVAGQNIFSLYGELEVVRRALSGVMAHDRTEAHGSFWENWYIPMQGDDGAVLGVIGLSLDVTETHKAKAEVEAKLAVVERQQDVIRNLETPIIQVWDQILTLPMVGVVDSRRAARVTDDLLDAVTRTQSRFAILDLTGVDVVDTSTAGHVLNIITAVRLLGAEGIITGIRPNVAQTMVSLGLDLSKVITLATLRDGLAFAVRRLTSNSRRASRS
jgi:anti-anti-sigma regulatory factor/PAS domain-containing protein